jgi:hypothetical protein
MQHKSRHWRDRTLHHLPAAALEFLLSMVSAPVGTSTPVTGV